MRDGIIFCRRIVQSVCEIQHAMREICGSLSDLVALAHLNDHDLVIRIACPASHAFETSLKRLPAAETRDHNGDFFRFAQLASHIKRVAPPGNGNARLLTVPFQMSFNRAPRSFELSRFLANVARAGTFAPPPMV